MNESLKALERIETVFHCNKQGKKHCYAHFMSPSKAVEEYYKDYNLVKQGLELKEHLEKENNELKDQIAYLKEELEGWQSAYEWSQSKNSILKLKNQELETTLLEYKAQENLYWTTATNNVNLREENEKLKKVLEIFKSAFVVDLFKETLLIKWKANLVEITEEEHNLLKEVLE